MSFYNHPNGSAHAPLNPACQKWSSAYATHYGRATRPDFAAATISVKSGRPLRYDSLTPFGSADSLNNPTQRVQPKIAGYPVAKAQTSTVFTQQT